MIKSIFNFSTGVEGDFFLRLRKEATVLIDSIPNPVKLAMGDQLTIVVEHLIGALALDVLLITDPADVTIESRTDVLLETMRLPLTAAAEIGLVVKGSEALRTLMRELHSESLEIRTDLSKGILCALMGGSASLSINSVSDGMVLVTDVLSETSQTLAINTGGSFSLEEEMAQSDRNYIKIDITLGELALVKLRTLNDCAEANITMDEVGDLALIDFFYIVI